MHLSCRLLSANTVALSVATGRYCVDSNWCSNNYLALLKVMYATKQALMLPERSQAQNVQRKTKPTWPMVRHYCDLEAIRQNSMATGDCKMCFGTRLSIDCYKDTIVAVLEDITAWENVIWQGVKHSRQVRQVKSWSSKYRLKNQGIRCTVQVLWRSTGWGAIQCVYKCGKLYTVVLCLRSILSVQTPKVYILISCS